MTDNTSKAPPVGAFKFPKINKRAETAATPAAEKQEELGDDVKPVSRQRAVEAADNDQAQKMVVALNIMEAQKDLAVVDQLEMSLRTAHGQLSALERDMLTILSRGETVKYWSCSEIPLESWDELVLKFKANTSGSEAAAIYTHLRNQTLLRLAQHLSKWRLAIRNLCATVRQKHHEIRDPAFPAMECGDIGVEELLDMIFLPNTAKKVAKQRVDAQECVIAGLEELEKLDATVAKQIDRFKQDLLGEWTDDEIRDWCSQHHAQQEEKIEAAIATALSAKDMHKLAREQYIAQWRNVRTMMSCGVWADIEVAMFGNLAKVYADCVKLAAARFSSIDIESE
ncbi:hypothetical protein LTR36_006026 [Oleoguttula mirabilis]|uniref:Uncharacterized protein n=1 Tax=Oleoguttula mirabilis TaxID=1507867 RepID=A0AAV9JDZ7_9PEZI|nr:hypothetical protein LTR36_006026 [Oleoguttula mirabilis]